jgi:hypothetical protein
MQSTAPGASRWFVVFKSLRWYFRSYTVTHTLFSLHIHLTLRGWDPAGFLEVPASQRRSSFRLGLVSDVRPST